MTPMMTSPVPRVPTTTQATTYGYDASIARFSVEQYQGMIEAGILTGEDKVELLENYVVLKMSRNPPHDSTIQQMLERIFLLRPPGWSFRVQSAIVLRDSQPEPDFALVLGSALNYKTRHPNPSEVALVIEVADSSLLRDQRDKTRIYARAGIPIYWIANLVDNRIEVYTLPSGPTNVPAYGMFQVFAPGDVIPLTLDGVVVASVPVAELLL